MLELEAIGLDRAHTEGSVQYIDHNTSATTFCSEIWGVRLTGKLPSWISAKDVILEMLRRHGVKGGLNRIIEYHGPGLTTLTAMDRHVIANMGAELGATTTVFPADDQVRAFLRSEQREGDFAELLADAGAAYDVTEEIDLSTIEPLIALPSSPGNVVSSRQILQDLTKMGATFDLISDGARLHQSGCMGCIGMGQAPANGSISLRTMPRNFPGRSGTKEDSVYLCSPETAAAAALTGTIADPRDLTELFDLEYPELELPAVSSVNLTMLEKPLPPEEASEVTLIKGQDISSLPVFGPLTDRIEAPVALVVGDDISTDEILPAGARVLPYRSNIPKLAAFTFDQIDRTYPARAARTRDTSGHIVVAGANYGQGSSREHAAITPRFLGLRAVVAVSFARIHWQNLAHFGVLALEFTNAADHGRIQQCDVLLLTGVRDALVTGTEILVHNESRDEVYPVRHGLSARQVQMLLPGGLIPWLRDRRAQDAQMNSNQSLL